MSESLPACVGECIRVCRAHIVSESLSACVVACARVFLVGVTLSIDVVILEPARAEVWEHVYCLSRFLIPFVRLGSIPCTGLV